MVIEDVEIRAFDPQYDTESLRKLDTSFRSDHAYKIASDDRSLRLSLVPAAQVVHKHFDIDLDADSWSHAFVSVTSGVVRGFIATKLLPWNHRLVISHFYVDHTYRRRGIGRRLMEQALREGKSNGALTAWIETSNLNHPAVEAYRRLGFSLCGFDATFYTGTPAEGEFALFLAQSLRDA